MIIAFIKQNSKILLNFGESNKMSNFALLLSMQENIFYTALSFLCSNVKNCNQLPVYLAFTEQPLEKSAYILFIPLY